jgi:endonuclease YncB( thermonuclease family)
MGLFDFFTQQSVLVKPIGEPIDGDTFDAQVLNGVKVKDPKTGQPTDRIRIRLNGCDAPESKHLYGDDQYGQPYGDEAGQHLAEFLNSAETIEARLLSTRYDRYNADITLKQMNGQEKDLAELMISAGSAWHAQPPYDTAKQRELMSKARGDKLGLWGLDTSVNGQPQQPWVYRDTKGKDFKSSITVKVIDGTTGREIPLSDPDLIIQCGSLKGSPLLLRNGTEQRITVRKKGYQAGAEVVTVSGEKTIEIKISPETPSSPTDEKESGPSKKTKDTEDSKTPGKAQPGRRPVSRPPLEDFVGNATDDFGASPEDVQYFTSAQVKLYIGNVWLDELSSIQFACQSNEVPLYGYCSRYADAYGEGRSLVQGQLTLNYTADWYLITVLDNYRKQLKNSQYSPEKQAAIARTAELLRKGQNLTGSEEDELSVLMAAVPYNALPSVKDLVKTPSRKGYDNAVYRQMVFNMVLQFGDGDHRTIRRLEACRLISNEQIIDQSGQTIFDSYGFVARRLK